MSSVPMSRRQCLRVHRWIERSFDGELSPGLQKRLTAHLAGCTVCKGEYEQTLRLHRLVRDAVVEEIDHGQYRHLWESVVEGIEERYPSRVGLFRKWLDTFVHLPVPVLVTSLLLIVGITLFLSFYGLFKPSVPQNECIVEFISCNTSPLMIYKDPDTNTTIIWYFDSREEDS